MKKSTRQQTLSSSNLLFKAGGQSEPTISDVMEMVKQGNEALHVKLDSVLGTVASLKTAVGLLTEELSVAKDSVKQLEQDKKKLNDEVRALMDKLDNLEGHSRRNNVVFHGIKEKKGKETWEDCEECITNVLSSVEVEIKGIERAHRLNTKSTPRPIIVKLASFKDRTAILQAKKRLPKDIFVNEDFTLRVRETRRKLKTEMERLKGQFQRVSLSFDHIIADGERFNWDEVSQQAVRAVRPATQSSQQSSQQRQRNQ